MIKEIAHPVWQAGCAILSYQEIVRAQRDESREKLNVFGVKEVRTAHFFDLLGNYARAAGRKSGEIESISGEGGAHGALFCFVRKLHKGSGTKVGKS